MKKLPLPIALVALFVDILSFFFNQNNLKQVYVKSMVLN